MTDFQVKELRHSGWTDEQILEATVVASLFNDINRIADALGVEPELILNPNSEVDVPRLKNSPHFF